MAKQTELLVPPTLDEIKREADKMGMPHREAEKFFWYWESMGWKRGRQKLKSWVGALNTWRLNWEERGGKKRVDQSANELNRSLDRTLKGLDQK